MESQDANVLSAGAERLELETALQLSARHVQGRKDIGSEQMVLSEQSAALYTVRMRMHCSFYSTLGHEVLADLHRQGMAAHLLAAGELRNALRALVNSEAVSRD